MSEKAPTTAASRRYARALFEAAADRGTLDEVAADVRTLDQITAQPAIAGWLADPRVEDQQKQALLERELGGRLQPVTVSFLRVLGRRRRHAVLPGVPAAFQEELDRHHGRLRGLAESARALSPEALQRLEQALTASTGKSVSLEHRLEPALLGGVRVTLGGVRYDGSVRGRLDSVRRRLSSADLGAR